MSEFQEMRLGDVLTVHHGFAFAGEGMTNVLTGNPIIVSIGNFSYSGGFRFGSTRVREFRGSYPKEFELTPDDLLVVMTCQTPGGEILGLPGMVPDDGRVYLHNQRIGRVDCDETRLTRRYAYYLFLSKVVNAQLAATASGTKILHTSPNRIADVRCFIPDLPSQHAIVSMLGALDNKIAVNERIASMSLELAQSEFQCATVGSPERKLGEIAAVTMGSSPPGESYNEDGEGLPFYQGVRDFGMRHPSPRVWCSSPVRIAGANDVLISVRAPVGRINVSAEACCIGRGLAAARSTAEAPDLLYHSIVAADAAWLPFESEGTVFGAINKNQLQSVSIRWPESESVADRLNLRLGSLNNYADSAIGQNRVLAELRDTLLPKLISGELRIDDAEHFVSDAV